MDVVSEFSRLLEQYRADWRRDALCADLDPGIFFPDGKGWTPDEAKSICARCPVRFECLDYAMKAKEEHGVWGGTTPAERRKIRKKPKQTT